MPKITQFNAKIPHTSHIHRTLLVSSPPPFLNTSSLPAPVIKCPGGLLIPSPSALALCSTLLLFLSFFFSPSFSLHLTPSPLAVATSPFSAVIKQFFSLASVSAQQDDVVGPIRWAPSSSALRQHSPNGAAEWSCEQV